MKFKTLIILFLFATALLSSGYRFHILKKNRPLLLFNTQPITSSTVNNPTRYVKAGQRLYYLLIVPQGIKDDYIRVQLIKKEQKTEHWGYKIYWAKDFNIEKGEKYFTSYIQIDEAGYYFLQIFSFDDFDWPLARNDFWVK